MSYYYNVMPNRTALPPPGPMVIYGIPSADLRSTFFTPSPSIYAPTYGNSYLRFGTSNVPIPNPYEATIYTAPNLNSKPSYTYSPGYATYYYVPPFTGVPKVGTAPGVRYYGY